MTHLPANVDVSVFRHREGVRWRARATCTDPATGNQLSVTTKESGESFATIAAAAAVQLLEAKLAEVMHSVHPAWTGTRCAVCKEPQFDTPGGVSCVNGHGGADSLQEE